MPLIDFHVHAFPDKVAPGAISALTAVVGPINCTDGTLADTLRHQQQVLHADRFVLYNIPTTPHQQRRANDFVLEANGADNGRIVSFGSLHPRAADAFEELERLVRAGIRGIKFHPEYQDFDMDDPTVYPLYQAIAEAGLVMTFHGGEDPAFPGRTRSCPQRAAKMVKDFAGAKIVIAHMGSSTDGTDTLHHLCGLDCWLDTSMAATHMPRQQFEAIVQKHGADKILFATDCPWGGKETYDAVAGLDIPQEDKEKIFWRNACALLGLDPASLQSTKGALL